VSALAVVTAATLMRVISVQRVLRYASRPVRGPAIDDHEIGIRIAAMERAGRYVPGATCLTKSLALAWLLRRRGIAAQVRVGVRTADGFESHAWVDLDGVALTDDRDTKGRFAELTGL
jgi:transglutaminase-like putative cysteine protease